jgi:hypothetical protein
MEGHPLMDNRDKLIELIEESDESVYLFVKDGKVTMVLGQDSDPLHLVDLFGYVTARILLNPNLDNSTPNMLQ